MVEISIDSDTVFILLGMFSSALFFGCPNETNTIEAITVNGLIITITIMGYLLEF